MLLECEPGNMRLVGYNWIVVFVHIWKDSGGWGMITVVFGSSLIEMIFFMKAIYS